MGRFTDSAHSIWLCWTPAVRLIAINIAVFLILHLFGAVNFFTGNRDWEIMALSAVELPASLLTLLQRPWTLLTYMFSQYDLFHLLFNMLWLYWFGTFLCEVRSRRDITAIYLSGGLAGAVAFLIVSNSFVDIGISGNLIGSSASVLAIVLATAIFIPDREVNLLFIGDMKLKWLALVMVVIDLINMRMGNTGGHIAHAGGMIAGIIAGIIMRKRALVRVIKHDYSLKSDLSDDEVIDNLLDKIRLSGYSSLTTRERNLLFKLSNRTKNRHK